MPGDGDADDDALRAEAEHWRALAQERDAAIRDLSHRPLVRVAVGVERRLGRPIHRASGWGATVRSLRQRSAVVLGSLPARAARGRRRAALGRAAASVDSQATAIAASLLTLGGQTSGADGAADGALSEVVRAPVAAGRSPLAALGEAAALATTDVLVFAPQAIDPLSPGWLAALTSVLTGDVVAATPTLVHPDRRGWGTTEHDQRVRSEGFAFELDGSGVPVVAARRAGAPVAPDRPAASVDAAPLLALVVSRAAFVAAGGLVDLGDEDTSAADLCLRLRRQGGQVLHVPAAVVVDGRPVPSRRALHHPVDATGLPWRRFIDRNGPEASRLARRAGAAVPARWVITTAVPSAKVAHRWGDWHFAEAMARSLRAAGRDVLLQTHDQADSLVGRSADVHLVLHGLTTVRRSPGQRHIVWVVSHPETFDPDDCDEADLVVVASERFAAHLRATSETPVEVLLQATDPERFRPCSPVPAHQHPVTVVAKTRNVLRPAVADALAAGFRPAIYGSGWERLVDPALVVADHVDNDELAAVYSSAGVVLNDHWDTMKGWGFVSNRVFDVLACGAPVISDDVAEIHRLFGDVVPTYRTVEELGALVRADLDDPEAARRRAAAGRVEVLEHHTFDRRARQLLDLVEAHGLAAADGVIPG